MVTNGGNDRSGIIIRQLSELWPIIRACHASIGTEKLERHRRRKQYRRQSQPPQSVSRHEVGAGHPAQEYEARYRDAEGQHELKDKTPGISHRLQKIRTDP